MPTGPSTPERHPPGPGPTPGAVRRSFTVPAKLESPRFNTPAASPGAENIETLFTHSFARVVSFTSAAPFIDRRSSLPVSTDGGEGTMPWGSSTERTIAAGPVKIYRVPNSVAFLNSGNLLHPILPKSQCWCVDGEAKFVLRVRANNYYRIELPYESNEDKDRVLDFKTVLGTVLQYEKTACPFRGGYEEPSITPEPIRKQRREPTERAKRWKFDKKWRPEGSGLSSDISEGSGPSASEEDDNASVTSSTRDESPQRLEESPSQQEENLSQRGRSSSVLPDKSGPGIAERTRRLLRDRSLTETQRPMPSIPKTIREKVEAPLLEERDSAPVNDVPPFTPRSHDTSPAEDKELTEARNTAVPSPPTPEVESRQPSAQHKVESVKSGTMDEPVKTTESHTTEMQEDMLDDLITPRVSTFPRVLARQDSIPDATPASLSHSTSVDSFYSLANTDSGPRSPSIVDTESMYEDPLPDQEELTVSHKLGHRRGLSELTITPHGDEDTSAEKTPRVPNSTIRLGSEPSTPTLISDSEDSFEPPLLDVPTPPDAIRLRKLTGASQRRSYSPMPHPNNLISATNRSRSKTRLVAATIVQKTCALLLSPPSHLVELMFKIAARIAAGFGVGSYHLGRTPHIPGSWESAEAEDEWDQEDDYGIPLQPIGSRDSSVASRERSRERRAEDVD